MQEDIYELFLEKKQKLREYSIAFIYSEKLPVLIDKYENLKMEDHSVLGKTRMTIEEILRNIEQIALNNNIELNSFTPEETDIGNIIRILFTGKFDNTVKFIYDLMNLSLDLECRNISIQRNNNNLKISLNLFHYLSDNTGGDKF
jgi:Tfp pilus assembly protein PilO